MALAWLAIQRDISDCADALSRRQPALHVAQPKHDVVCQA